LRSRGKHPLAIYVVSVEHRPRTPLDVRRERGFVVDSAISTTARCGEATLPCRDVARAARCAAAERRLRGASRGRRRAGVGFL